MRPFSIVCLVTAAQERPSRDIYYEWRVELAVMYWNIGSKRSPQKQDSIDLSFKAESTIVLQIVCGEGKKVEKSSLAAYAERHRARLDSAKVTSEKGLWERPQPHQKLLKRKPVEFNYPSPSAGGPAIPTPFV